MKINVLIIIGLVFVSGCVLEDEKEDTPIIDLEGEGDDVPFITEDDFCAGVGDYGPNPSLGPSDPNKDAKCCPKLVIKAPKKAYDSGPGTECQAGTGFGTVCLACGDDECDLEYESYCNCPEDCAEDKICIKENENIAYYEVNAKHCCEGLNLLHDGSDSRSAGYICTYEECGDGECSSVENKINCVEDCE
jgi:hypothetical protein